MPHSYHNLLYHLVFSTKGRRESITEELEPRLHEYLGGAIRGQGGVLLEINGARDHVHIAARLSQRRSVEDILREIKANSSKWVHQTFEACGAFAWQSGYGAFTVSESQLDKLRRYLQNQKEHHKHTSFQEEFEALLKAHGVEYDTAYLWR